MPQAQFGFVCNYYNWTYLTEVDDSVLSTFRQEVCNCALNETLSGPSLY